MSAGSHNECARGRQLSGGKSILRKGSKPKWTKDKISGFREFLCGRLQSGIGAGGGI